MKNKFNKNSFKALGWGLYTLGMCDKFWLLVCLLSRWECRSFHWWKNISFGYSLLTVFWQKYWKLIEMKSIKILLFKAKKERNRHNAVVRLRQLQWLIMYLCTCVYTFYCLFSTALFHLQFKKRFWL